MIGAFCRAGNERKGNENGGLYDTMAEKQRTDLITYSNLINVASCFHNGEFGDVPRHVA